MDDAYVDQVAQPFCQLLRHAPQQLTIHALLSVLHHVLVQINVQQLSDDEEVVAEEEAVVGLNK